MKNKIFDMKIENNKIILVVKCPKCEREKRLFPDNLTAGTKIPCDCKEYDFGFTNNDLRNFQRSFDNMIKSIKKLKKNFEITI